MTYFPQNKRWEQAVSEGRINGYSVVDKFGANHEIATGTDPEDIWEEGGVYNYTANAGALYYMSSSDNADTQLLKFSVLTVDSNGNWNDEKFTQQLAGQTKTQLLPPSGDPVVRIYRIENEADAGGDLSGKVYVYEDTTVSLGVPSDPTKVRATVDNGNNQTLMALYTIPTGFVGFLTKGEVGINYSGGVSAGTQFANIYYLSRRYGKVFKIKKEISCMTTGNNNFQDDRCFPDIIPAKTDIKLQVHDVSETMGAWATFCILLVEEDKLPEELLTRIGQIKRV